MGAAATGPAEMDDVPNGGIHMHIGRGGYVGMVRMSDGRVHVAAALDPAVCREAGGPGAAVRMILDYCGRPAALQCEPLRYDGAGLLTRRRERAGGHRVLAVGDALGYVEPFTGEGMAWAIEGAMRAVDLLPEKAQTWPADLPERWEDEMRRSIQAKQRWCRGLRPVVHYPALAGLALAAGRAIPAAAQFVASCVCEPRAKTIAVTQRGAG
jgi:flavin-dependent dehydrogenase